MNVSIEDFTEADFEHYMSYAVDEYAEAHVKSGKWTKEEAKSKAQGQFDRLLKDGLKSEGHTFWKMCLDGKKVGDFWFHRNAKDRSKIFIYDTRVETEYQGKGVATASFSLVKDRLNRLGVKLISIHVFTHNTGAIRLYERLGFDFVSHIMAYKIEE